MGGVCPFALPEEIDIYLDESLKDFEVVYPSAGSTNSAVKMTPEEILKVTEAQWVDVCNVC